MSSNKTPSPNNRSPHMFPTANLLKPHTRNPSHLRTLNQSLIPSPKLLLACTINLSQLHSPNPSQLNTRNLNFKLNTRNLLQVPTCNQVWVIINLKFHRTCLTNTSHRRTLNLLQQRSTIKVFTKTRIPINNNNKSPFNLSHNHLQITLNIPTTMKKKHSVLSPPYKLPKWTMFKQQQAIPSPTITLTQCYLINLSKTMIQ